MASFEHSQSYGKYIPYLMLISVKRTFDNFSKISEINQFREEEIITFFHEYMHHVHNISTIVGMSRFNSIITLWHGIRNFNDGFRDSPQIRELEKAISIQNQWFFNNDSIAITENFQIKEIAELNHESPCSPIEIKCKSPKTSDLILVKFGIPEFMESAAFLLEETFRSKIYFPKKNNNVNFVPYKIGMSIAKHINHEISEYQVLHHFLAAMQAPEPHYSYLNSLKQLAPLKISDEIAIDILKEFAKKQIKINQPWIENIESQINKGFCYEDPLFGDIIKHVFHVLKNNLHLRNENPFKEVELLENINIDNYQNSLNEVIRTFGGCVLIRDRDDTDEDEANKDNMFFLKGNDNIDIDLRAWLVFQAAIHFTLCHINRNASQEISIVETSEISLKNPCQCPFFTCCLHENRKNLHSSQICKNSPWNHPKAIENGDNCDYQVAVFKTQLENITSCCTQQFSF